MLYTPNSVELLAPVGTWDVLTAAIEAGADAVYFGGKRFNMRLHRTDVSFDDEQLAKAIEYAHSHNRLAYITVNNLISERETDNIRTYLKLLDEIGPDAIIVQDLSVVKLAHELGISIPLHASVMMNVHNEYAVRTLQDYGITRIVAGRELSLSQLTLLKERTGIELEYFVHGDMCISHSGQCLHSGILFGQSSNRGRCLKPCRWPYQLVDAQTRKPLANNDPGPYKLALKDMCMYLHLPELIQSGVCSFKIEGRMRTADFVSRIVKVYRRAIDRYIADPTGYTVNLEDWQEMYQGRARDFSTCYAIGYAGADAIGYTGEREPRYFSQAVKEAGITATATIPPAAQETASLEIKPVLAVRVADLDSVHAACQSGADILYVGGEAFKPANPWTLDQISTAITTAAKFNAKVIVTTPRITAGRECGELEQLFTKLGSIQPHAIMMSNIGSLRLAQQPSSLPVHADFSFNLFNHITTRWLKDQGVNQATISPEATYEQIAAITGKTAISLELIVHGPIEAMILDHCIPAAVLGHDKLSLSCYDNCHKQQYALLDSAEQTHAIKIDQYCRSHILFAKDLCLLPYLSVLTAAGLSQYRIEGQHYTPEHIGLVVAAYRQELDKLAANPCAYNYDSTLTEKIAATSPHELGIGAFRYRISR